MKTVMSFVLMLMVTLSAPAAWAGTEMGDRATPNKRLGVGPFKCGLGSYKARTCRVVEQDGAYFLIVPAKTGHSVPFKAQVLGSDESGELVLVGHLLKPNRLCSAGEPKDCQRQPIVVILKAAKNGNWYGKMSYWLYRTDPAGVYRHGVTERFVIRK